MKQKSLLQEHRLKKKSEYQNLRDHPEVIKLSGVIVFRKPNAFDHPRIGITVKGEKLAVKRNKMKRIIREWFRNHLNELGFFDYNVVVSVRTGIALPLFEKVRRSLTERFAKKV